ncbi:hypothetical protein QBC35DRAFT_229154 [Podospora australis]|uniref:Meiotically up-regulated protein Msb1/Mug8 domain-containing protein n=1 Tax=Podospora australis TaxID=1536484 RepID=A0AAN7AMJ8_9PEZI|nr:hypothetical protein QBC35DRAFT_229154 [Podospora australis]
MFRLFELHKSKTSRWAKMPGLFSRLKGKDSKKKKQLDLTDQLPQKPRWDDAWTRKTIEPEEVVELIRYSTEELKARALDLPFLLLPFRPTSDPSAVRTFVRHFFDGKDGAGLSQPLHGEALAQELRMTEPMVISGVIKWCWSRLQGGVVGWDSYELFKVGEQDSNMARDSFKTFIPLSVDNKARSQIIFYFFDLLSAVAAHGKTNGFGGRKLSRMAAWWAFEQPESTNGFEGAYKAWLSAADATSHLFFAYLRSLAPEPVLGAISLLPMSLQKLLQETEYPPQRPQLMQTSTHRVAMIVDTVSPTPFALLRRANHFQYRDDDRALKEWSEYEDPIQALTEECRRVLRAISAANQSQAVSSSKHSTSLRDASWSRFEDIGFASALEEEDEMDDSLAVKRQQQRLRNTPASGTDLGRPTTPSWADFLSSGFVDEKNASSHLLPPDKVLPPIETNVRQRSSQSHKPRLENENFLEPGELASIVRFDLDDAFWWVWLTSLAPEETPERKATFGRCAVIETIIRGGRWLVMEEIVKGAAPDPADGAYIAEKKGFFSWTRRGKGTSGLNRSKSTAGKHALEKSNGYLKPSSTMGFGSKTSIGPDQQAKIQAAALQLQMQERQKAQPAPERRGRNDFEVMAEKTNSVLTLQSSILSEASPAVKWANKYDKETIKSAYLADNNAGRGGATPSYTNGSAAPSTNGHDSPPELPPKTTPPPQAAKPSSPPQPTPVTAPVPAPPKESPRSETPTPVAAVPTEKQLEAPLDIHPAERISDAGRSTPLPPPKQSVEVSREHMVSPEPESPERRQNKLQKELTKSPTAQSGGFRKLFGRGRRGSKIPDGAPEQVNAFIAADNAFRAAQERNPVPAPAPPVVPNKIHKKEVPPPAAPKAEPVVVPPPQARKAVPAPAPTPASAPVPAHVAAPVAASTPEPTYEPSTQEEISRVNTRDAAAANEEFSRFDQGPLLDQPAFIPDDGDDDVEDAVPPPIARHSSRSPLPSPASPPPKKDEPVSPVSPSAPAPKPVDPMDRWAQIRKNAAERAAQRQPAPPVSPELRKPPGFARHLDDGDTSGEESKSRPYIHRLQARFMLTSISFVAIESRVARIKARVAELTGGAEGMGPGSRTPPPPIRR